MKRFPFLLIIGLLGCDSPSTPKVTSETDSQTAYTAAKELVRRSLKSPSSAKFWKRGEPGESDRNSYALHYAESGLWTANGTLESQNAFGAMLQHDWEAAVRKTATGWRLEWLKIDDEKTGPKPDLYAAPMKEYMSKAMR